MLARLWAFASGVESKMQALERCVVTNAEKRITITASNAISGSKQPAYVAGAYATNRLQG